MYSMSNNEDTLAFTVSSRLANIDRMVDEINNFVKEYGDFNTSSLIQIFRELMLNAIEHGNKNISEKCVEITLENIDTNRYLLQVKDEGEGISSDFFPVKDELRSAGIRNRGLALINSLADEFLKGEEQNSLSAYITLPKSFDWGVVYSDEKTLIEPTRDISAAVLEDLRKLLFQWLENDTPSCELSLKYATNLDSVSLSLLISFSVYLNESEKADNFVISGVSPDLKILFEMTQLGRLFRIEDAVKI